MVLFLIGISSWLLSSISAENMHTIETTNIAVEWTIIDFVEQ